jgi:cytosine/uracil/thiamine/allantoin permease
MRGVIAKDLKEVKAEFAQWRENERQGGEIIPPELWQAAMALLENYAMSAECRELGLSYKQMGKQLANGKATAAFMELNAQQLGVKAKIEKQSSSSV